MSVTLDKKHGVNPGLGNCFICNEPRDVILFGQMGKSMKEAVKAAGLEVGPDGKAPNGIIMDMEPCDKCRGYMEQGIILISCRDTGDPEEMKNPYRTGGWVVVKEEVILRIVQPKEMADDIVKKRMAFVPDEAWDMLGLPRGGEDEVDSAARGTDHD